MATRPDAHAALEPATQAEVDAALGPFIARFVAPKKRERVTSLFMPMRKRARPRDLVDVVDPADLVQLDGSARALAALARVDPELDGIYLDGSPAAFRTTFAHARGLGVFGYSDEELFIARAGQYGLILGRGERCTSCGETLFDESEVERQEREIATAFVTRGIRTGAEFKLVRKLAGLRANEVADMFAVRPETVSRWERGEVELPRIAAYALGELYERPRVTRQKFEAFAQ